MVITFSDGSKGICDLEEDQYSEVLLMVRSGLIKDAKVRVLRYQEVHYLDIQELRTNPPPPQPVLNTDRAQLSSFGSRSP